MFTLDLEGPIFGSSNDVYTRVASGSNLASVRLVSSAGQVTKTSGAHSLVPSARIRPVLAPASLTPLRFLIGLDSRLSAQFDAEAAFDHESSNVDWTHCIVRRTHVLVCSHLCSWTDTPPSPGPGHPSGTHGGWGSSPHVPPSVSLLLSLPYHVPHRDTFKAALTARCAAEKCTCKDTYRGCVCGTLSSPSTPLLSTQSA